jgi:hypothetical protein
MGVLLPALSISLAAAEGAKEVFQSTAWHGVAFCDALLRDTVVLKQLVRSVPPAAKLRHFRRNCVFAEKSTKRIQRTKISPES